MHGLPFEDNFFEDHGIPLRDRNSVIRDIYNNLFTDSRRSIAFKGYQTGQLLKNMPDTVPLINLDSYDFPEMCDMPDLPFMGRCERHYWNLYCCKQSCVYYTHWMLSNNLTMARNDIEDVISRLEHLNI